MKINWGTGIAIFYTCFAVTMIYFVIKSTTYDHSLVQEDYYQADLDYQTHYDKLKNSQSQPLSVKHRAGNDFIILQLLDTNFKDISGDIAFFRPSNKGQDVHLPLELSVSGQQSIPTHQLAPGFWRVKIDWEANGTGYYTEVEVVL